MLRRWLGMVCAVLIWIGLLGACGQVIPETPEPTSVPEPEPILAPADPWTRIQQSGRIIVGVSADYAPFEYYNDSFRIDGFDPALMWAMAEILGVEVQLLDIAFEGLPAALELGQIDVAISALSVTPERLGRMDFSQVYFVSEDAVISRVGAEIPAITALPQMALYRVGVQEGSLYESLLTQSLVETGLMPATHLMSYRNFESVVNDLVQNRLDLVMMDLIPAERLVVRGEAQIVGRGLDNQSYAIAVRPGAQELQSELNRALATVRADGTLAQLIADYLLIEEEHQPELPAPSPVPATLATATPLLPRATETPAEMVAPTPAEPAAPLHTDTPQPTATLQATPTPPVCVDSMRWIADLNFDDQGMINPPSLPPGQPFQKGWRVQNTGTCTWGSAYGLEFVQGNTDTARMGGVFRPVSGAVAPGELYDFYVDLVAPITPGTYQGIWQLQDGSGTAFGERIWVGITVPAPATPTPMPTPTATDFIDFRADRVRVNAGERVVFSWRVENVTSVYFYAQGQRWEDHGVGGVDSREVFPMQSTTYELRVVGMDGQVRAPQIRVEVAAVTGAPRLARFVVDPPGAIAPGQCYMLQWDVEGSVNRVRIQVNNSTAWDYAPVRGSWNHCPGTDGTYSYALVADGTGGSARGGETRIVQGGAPPSPPTSVAPQQEPIVYGFSAQPIEIRAGACVTVAWTAGAGTQYVRLTRDGAVILDGGPVAGNVQDCIGAPGPVNYRLEARTNAGGVATAQTSVNVVP